MVPQGRKIQHANQTTKVSNTIQIGNSTSRNMAARVATRPTSANQGKLLK